MKEKILSYMDRLQKVEELLGDPQVVSDQKKFKELTQEHSHLISIKESWDLLQKSEKDLSEHKEMLKEEKDPEFIELLQDEKKALEEMIPKIQSTLETLLVPPDPLDDANVIVELRAGTGGDEAAIFVGDCMRMYKLYADRSSWNVEVISSAPSEAGGFKECVLGISGKNVFRFMQYEAGTHRVQRVPVTETQGRVHTSAITVAVLPEPDESEPIKIEEKDLKIDTYRASGAGGQHVNTTDSAVRITHLPTNTVVYCQEERSQHKNKEKAMRVLSAKLAEVEAIKQQKERADLRSSQVGSGDRSERIRTYNFPQNRITDHRIDLTLYNLDRVMQGELEEISNALVKHFYELKLKH